MSSLKETLNNYTKLQLPKLFVFDLDFTLWPFWVDTHVSPPFTKDRNGLVTDSLKREVGTYPDVKKMLQALKEHGCFVAAASRTDTPKEAKELLIALDIYDNFHYKEIYPGKKTTHFARFRESSGIEYKDMIFFDDEMRNITDITRLGVTCIYVENGINMELLLNGVKQHVSKQQ